MNDNVTNMLDKIVLYGAGIQNFYLAWLQIKSAGLDVCFAVDRDENLQGSEIFGVKVVSLEKLRQFDSEQNEKKYTIVVTIRAHETVKDVLNSLSGLKNAYIYDYDSFFSQAKLRYCVKDFAQMLVHLTDHCNLNCARCSHCAPLFKDNPSYLDETAFENDLKKLKSLGVKNYMFELAGGEPLLHPNAHKFPYIVKKYFPGTQVAFVTNGILLEKMGTEFYQSCLDNNAEIWVTYYPVNFDYNQAIQRIKDKGIKIKFGNPGEAASKQKNMWRTPIRLEGDLDPAYNFEHCDVPCFLLRNGLIYPCCTAIDGEFLNSHFGTHLPQLEQTGVNIHTAKSKAELMEKVSKPAGMCSHCDIKYKNLPLPWAVSRTDLSEWVIDEG
ncbi:MAG: hypothetical protein Ta2B_17300 [Termitinemataceae bacterium]|nr:MAG: hypothetical protein Ta2B_17300 [Termitinemataceae bacterium]